MLMPTRCLNGSEERRRLRVDRGSLRRDGSRPASAKRFSISSATLGPFPLPVRLTKGRHHPVVPSALANAFLRARVSPEKNLVDALAISLDLTADHLGECALPKSSLLTEELLQLRRRCPPRIIKKFETGHTAVAIEHHKLRLVRPDERKLVDLALGDDVLGQIPHMDFALIEEPRDSGGFVFQFAVSVVSAVHHQ
jgi:hypothetical protein